MGQDFRLLAPVRGLTRPPIPHPFHGLWQNCPETFLHEDIDFFFPPSQSRRHTWPHGQALPRQHGSCWCPSQDVFKVTSFNDRDQGTRPLASRTQDPPQRGLHSDRSKFGGYSIAPTGPRYVVLAPANTARALRLVESTLGSQVCKDPFACRQSAVAPRFATPLHCRHSVAFNGLILDWSQPATLWFNPPWHLLPQVLEKLRASRARGILVYPYWPL
jgi:hypothetical protein